MDLRKIGVEKIPVRVKEYVEERATTRRSLYVAYLENKRGEVIERVFSAQRYSKKGIMITEILRRSTGKARTICKNLLFAHCCGYITVYEAKDKYSHSGGYPFLVFPKEEFDVWDIATMPCGFERVLINPEKLREIEEFRYCGYSGGDIISYLTMFRKDKNVEMFGKMGLQLSPILMRKAKDDGQFRRWLWGNHKAVAAYGVQAALFAYALGITVDEARMVCYEKNRRDRLAMARVPELKGTTLDRRRVLDYIGFNNINYASYNDYLKAMKALNYNLNDTKNIYPMDFERMHELRAAEYESFMEKEDKRKRRELYKAFEEKAKQSKKFEAQSAEYIIVAPHSITDLKREGVTLHHCVGKMGYDKKMADGVSLIMFCRKIEEPSTPFVTIEYRLDKKTLNQCYGCKDSRPSDAVVAFVNEWARNITNMLKEENANG